MVHAPAPTPPQAQRLRVLFYLPVVTPWWFTHIVIHLIRAMAKEHEVHVLIPPLWKNTGIGADQTVLIADLPDVFWHILDGPDHPQLRIDASGQEDLIELVRQIDPHLTLCRSADIKTPRRFPGTVRFIMEAAAPPLPTAPECVWLAPTLFDHGILPDLSPNEASRIDDLALPLWPKAKDDCARQSRHAFLKANGLPTDQAIIGLPLEYEHEENFFNAHHSFASNADMIAQITGQLSDDCVLAVTNHPLTSLYGDTAEVEAAIEASQGKAILLGEGEEAGSTTAELARHCDGMIVGNSKSWSVCAALGTPMMRYSSFATGDWVNAYHALPEFLADIASGTARSACPKEARRWFLYHLTNCLIDPTDPSLSAEHLIEAAVQSAPQYRWTQIIERYQSRLEEAAA